MVPAISVVLPFRDAGATLAEALDSIRGQTLEAFECLLLDHGSVDSSRALALATAERDPRFRVITVAGSFAAVLNAGIAAARAPLVARMDADDIADPQRFAYQYALLESDPSLALASCLVESFPSPQVQDGLRRYDAWLNAQRTPEQIRDAIFVESPLAHPSVMVRRDALSAAGGYRDFDGPEDYDLWLRLLLAGARAAKVGRLLLRWRDWPGRLSRVDPRCHRRRFLATKLDHLPTVLAPGNAVQICGAGASGRTWARELRARGYRVTRFVDVDPRRWGRTIDGVEIHPPERLDRGDGFILAAAGAVGARDRIRPWLEARGLRLWDDFLLVA